MSRWVSRVAAVAALIGVVASISDRPLLAAELQKAEYSAAATGEPVAAVAGEVLVKLRRAVDRELFERFVARHGELERGPIPDRLVRPNVRRLRGSVPLEEAIAALRQDREVLAVEPNSIATVFDTFAGDWR
jgi:hypothetical protein